MKIGINTFYVVPGDVGGAEYYLLNLIKGLFAIDRHNEYVLFVTPENKHLYLPPYDNFKMVVLPFSNRKRSVRILFEQTALPFYAQKEKLDLLHSPNNVAPLIKNTASVLTIQTLHAFQYAKELPSFLKTLYRKMHMRISSRMADHIITPCEFTRKDVIEIHQLSSERVTSILDYVSIPILYPDGIHTDHKVLRQYGIEKPYIFSPSSMFPYKNIQGMLKALRILQVRFKLPHTLVIAGRDETGYYPYMKKLAGELGVLDRFKYLRCVPHQQTPSLYRFADLTLYPSYSETFGIPLLESMAIGTPVVCSNRSSLPEVAGDGAVLVDPDDVEGMCQSIQRLMQDTEFKKEIVKKGHERARMFSHENAAKQTLDVYQSVCAARRK